MDRFRHIIFTSRTRIHPGLLRGNSSATATRRRAVPSPVRDDTVNVPEEVKRFLQRVISPAKVDLGAYRLGPFARRIPACLRALKVNTIDAAEQKLDKHPELWPSAIDALLIGVTRFYRDAEIFDDLRARWLPALLSSRDGLSVWCVGVSDGAELLSIAALLAEKGALSASQLRGTDCRPAAIQAARRSRYQQSALADLPPALRREYFRLDSESFVPANALALVPIDWRVEDAFACTDSEKWDLILCRNLAIYLSATMQARLWMTLRAALKPGGLLIVGKAERPCIEGLRRVSPCIYGMEAN